MSFLNKLFGSPEKENSSETFWKNITSEEDLNKAIEESATKKVAIFKHSTSCFISKTVLKNFEKEVENLNFPEKIDSLKVEYKKDSIYIHYWETNYDNQVVKSEIKISQVLFCLF